MLKKNRISAMILIAACGIAFTAGEALSVPGFPGWWVKASSPAALVVIPLIIAVYVILASRTDWVMQLGDEGFGLQGLLRWSGFGLLLGEMYGTLKTWLDIWPGSDSLFQYFFEVFGTFSLVTLLYWLFFRRFFWTTRFPMDIIPKRSSPISKG